MPYCDVPAAIAPWISGVLSLSMMQSRMNAVVIMTSTAGTRPVPSARGSRRCDDRRLQHARELDADLPLLVRREHRDDAVDGLGGVERVQRREHEVAGLGREQRRLDRLEVAHFADQDDVGVLPQRAAQRVGERLRVDEISRWLTIDWLSRCRYSIGSSTVMMCAGARGVDVVDHRGQRRALAAAGRAGDEHQAALFVGDRLEHRRQAELVDRLDLASG